MPNLALDLRYLRCALTAADLGSFRRTALALQLPQSTVSRRIQLLERQLGFPIFTRDRRGSAVTDSGTAFLKDAALAAAQLACAAEAAASLHREEARELRIGISTALVPGRLQNMLSDFRYRFPSIRIMLIELPKDKIVHGLLLGRADAAICAMHSGEALLKSKTLWKKELAVVVNGLHVLASRPSVRFGDLASQRIVFSSQGIGRDLSRRISKIGHRKNLDLCVELHDVSDETIMNLVAIGDGITFACQRANGSRHDTLVYIPTDDEKVRSSLSLLWSSENKSAALRHFIDFVDNASTPLSTGRKAPVRQARMPMVDREG